MIKEISLLLLTFTVVTRAQNLIVPRGSQIILVLSCLTCSRKTSALNYFNHVVVTRSHTLFILFEKSYPFCFVFCYLSHQRFKVRAQANQNLVGRLNNEV
jgi:hypothetical protein